MIGLNINKLLLNWGLSTRMEFLKSQFFRIEN